MKIKPRSLALALGAVALLVLGAALYRSGVLDADSITAAVSRLGAWALPAYVALFVLGTLLQIPGIVFVVAAPLAFGPTLGFAAAYLGAVLAVTMSFLLVRAVRGKRREPIQLPLRWAQRLLEGAESRPFVSVVVLRTLFFLSPPLNVGLGFSALKTRDYVLGSAVGIAAPLAVIVCTVGAL